MAENGIKVENKENEHFLPEVNQRAEFVLDASGDNFENKTSLRGQWSNRVEFFLAIMGYTVGIGSVWRFPIICRLPILIICHYGFKLFYGDPYTVGIGSVWRFPIICSQNGGGAFLVPFFFFLLLSGGPLYYMEVCIGQFSGKSAGLAFGFCPLLKGLGFLQVSLCFLVLWYVVFVSVWIYYYLYSSFSGVLPWTTCNNQWNTIDCRQEPEPQYLGKISSNSTTLQGFIYNKTVTNTPAFEFWQHYVIGKSSGLEDMGTLQSHLVLCLVISWFLTVLAVIKGTKSLGKVVYVSATLPFLLLGIIFVRGLCLEGSVDGIKFYLTPDFSYLLKISTWLEAALQVFYSLGPTWGGVITMASYNKFHDKTFWSCALCVACSGFTSFFNGLVVFTILGFMPRQSGTTVEQLASESGTGLVFVAFPTALSKMPLPQFWSILFFLMLVTVTFDSIFGMFETVTSAIIDLFPTTLTSKRVYVNIGLGTFLTVTALPLCSNGGIYIIQLCDWYVPRYALLLGSLLECVAVFWIYGVDRICADIMLMTGRKTSTLLRIMWSMVTPLFLIICFFLTSIKFTTPDYGDGYVYQPGAIAIGVLLGLLPILGMVGTGIVVMLRTNGTFYERVRICLRPDSTWRPNNETTSRDYEAKPYKYPPSFKQRLLVDLMGRHDTYEL